MNACLNMLRRCGNYLNTDIRSDRVDLPYMARPKTKAAEQAEKEKQKEEEEEEEEKQQKEASKKNQISLIGPTKVLSIANDVS